MVSFLSIKLKTTTNRFRVTIEPALKKQKLDDGLTGAAPLTEETAIGVVANETESDKTVNNSNSNKEKEWKRSKKGQNKVYPAHPAQ